MDSKTDAKLTADVYAELEADPAASVADLGVIANDGHVTLDGTTATQAAKDASSHGLSSTPGPHRMNPLAVDRIRSDGVFLNRSWRSARKF